MVGGFLRKIQKICFCAVQIEKPEINILQKEWRKKAFLLFKIKVNLINPLRRSLIKIHRQLSGVKRYANCSRFGCFIPSQLSFLSNFLYVRTKTQENFLPIFVFVEAEEAKIWQNKIFGSERPWVAARGGEGVVLWEFLGGDVPLGPWNPQPIPELVQLNFATLYQSKLPKSPQLSTLLRLICVDLNLPIC